MQETIFITGATGLVGSNLANRLLHRRPEATVVLLVRNRSSTTLHSLRRSTRVQLVEGGLDHDGFHAGPSRDRKALTDRVTEIYHVAAETRFHAPWHELESINIEGTRRLIAFALECSKLRRFHHVSTAFVSGDRTGRILEEERDVGQAFSNGYEKSKLHAEAIFDEWQGILPFTIYRPSIVAGDSRSGATTHFRGLYQILKASFANLLPVVPGERSFPLDVVPVDFVCDALLAIGSKTRSIGGTFHLTAGGKTRMPIGPMFDLWRERAARHGITIQSPRFVPPHEFDSLAPRETRSVRLMQHLVPYLNQRTEFDRRKTEPYLADAGIPSVPFAAYYGNLIDFAIERSFGLRSAETESKDRSHSISSP